MAVCSDYPIDQMQSMTACCLLPRLAVLSIATLTIKSTHWPTGLQPSLRPYGDTGRSSGMAAQHIGFVP